MKEIIEEYLMGYLNKTEDVKKIDRGYIEISSVEEYDALPVLKVPYLENKFSADDYYKIHNVILVPSELNYIIGLLLKNIDWDMFWNEIEKGEIWENTLEWVSSHARKEGVERVDIRAQYKKLMYLVYEIGNKINWEKM